MRIWLLTVGEPLPIDAQADRLLRTGILAELLTRRGHEVVWWTSALDHVRKTRRAGTSTRLEVRDGYHMWLLHGPPYLDNVSVARLLNHRAVAQEFRRLAPLEAQPEVLVCSFPLIELSLAATQFARRRGRPIALDVRDFWPDIFDEMVPRPARPLARLAMWPLARDVRRAMRAGTAITGITEAAVDWGLERAGRPRRPLDRAFHLAYPDRRPPPEAIRDAAVWWDAQGVREDAGRFTGCFMGVVSRRLEVDVVVEAAARLPLEARERIRLVLCGNGSLLDELRERAADLPHVFLPGWVDWPRIWTLLRRSSVGILPYPSTLDFTRSVPNKVGEYMSAGLPVLNSVRGEMSRLLVEERFGVTYGNGDAEGLADLLCALAADPERVASLSARSREVFARRFTAERVYGEYADWVEELGRGTGAVADRNDGSEGPAGSTG